MKKVNFSEDQLSNDGAFSLVPPYAVEVDVTGTAPLLFHRWSVADVEAKAAASKNSRAKKSDNTESYLYRNETGEICLPTEYIRQAVIAAAKYRQDPRSPRKSACDLFKAGLVGLHELASLGATEPDYLDRRRVTIMRAGITRTRPAMNTGWHVMTRFEILLPEYVGPELLQSVLTDAGRLVGIGDFRPTFGRFAVTRFEVLRG